MMYICAWQAPELQPWWLISWRISAASLSPRPMPPYSSGISAASQPPSVSAATNASGYALSRSSSRQYSPGNCRQSSATPSRIAI